MTRALTRERELMFVSHLRGVTQGAIAGAGLAVHRTLQHHDCGSSWPWAISLALFLSLFLSRLLFCLVDSGGWFYGMKMVPGTHSSTIPTNLPKYPST